MFSRNTSIGVGYYGFSKAERIKKSQGFQTLFNDGQKAVTPFLVFHYAPNGLSYNRLGVVAGRKLGGAVVRNRLKRLLREVYRLNKHLLRPGYDMLLVARAKMLEASLAQLEQEFQGAVSQAGLMQSFDL